MMDIYQRHVLEILANNFNEYSKTAAYWRQCEHDGWDKHATGATAVLECVNKLFPKSGYSFKFKTETQNGITFEWRKMEVA